MTEVIRLLSVQPATAQSDASQTERINRVSTKYQQCKDISLVKVNSNTTLVIFVVNSFWLHLQQTHCWLVGLLLLLGWCRSPGRLHGRRSDAHKNNNNNNCNHNTICFTFSFTWPAGIVRFDKFYSRYCRKGVNEASENYVAFELRNEMHHPRHHHTDLKTLTAQNYRYIIITFKIKFIYSFWKKVEYKKMS